MLKYKYIFLIKVYVQTQSLFNNKNFEFCNLKKL